MADLLNFNKKPVATGTPDRTDVCGVCAFAVFDPDRPNLGACHSKPPQMVVVPQMNELRQPVINIQGYFPVVTPDGWCGDFEPADGEPDGSIPSSLE